MARSSRTFDRWKAHESSTWALQVFSKYDSQLMGLWGTHISSAAFTYQQLGKNHAQWQDKPGSHFQAGVHVDSYFSDLKQWSESYNSFSNWVNLSVVLTLAANLETYIASVVRVAIESDPGLLLGSPKTVDGAYLRKHGEEWVVDLGEHLESCTKGDWSSRFSALRRVFGSIPPGLSSVHADLEEVRRVRNRFGHAFGREIDLARRTGTLELLPMEPMKRKRVERLRASILRGAKELDRLLLEAHIGEFEAVLFYANLFPGLNQKLTAGQRAADLKKAIGGHGAVPRGKKHCKGLVEYWEGL